MPIADIGHLAELTDHHDKTAIRRPLNIGQNLSFGHGPEFDDWHRADAHRLTVLGNDATHGGQLQFGFAPTGRAR
jgi:hypothetical protein